MSSQTNRAGVVVGVDGGNSKTVALVASAGGAIIGYARGGCADIYAAASAAEALSEVALTVFEAADGAGKAAERVDVGAFSLAGADWPEDIDFLERSIRDRGLARQVQVVNDAIGALRAGSPDGTGLSVVCGTGAAIGARNAGGASWHSGWWQEPQGSRHLARQALRAVYRSDLAVDPPTSLTARVLEIHDASAVQDVLHSLTRREGRAPDRFAAVTAALLDEAEDGDLTALKIVRDHGLSLGDYACAAARKVALDGDFSVVLTGGVFRHSGTTLPDAIVERIRMRYPSAKPALSPCEPAVGALLLALEMAGTIVDEAVLGRMRDSMPPAELFGT